MIPDNTSASLHLYIIASRWSVEAAPLRSTDSSSRTALPSLPNTVAPLTHLRCAPDAATCAAMVLVSEFFQSISRPGGTSNSLPPFFLRRPLHYPRTLRNHECFVAAGKRPFCGIAEMVRGMLGPFPEMSPF